MSYGRFVQACIDERRRRATGGQSVERAEVKFANDNFPDFPEHRVIAALRQLRWPDRPVTVSEVQRWLRRHVSDAEQRRWLDDLDAGRV